MRTRRRPWVSALVVVLAAVAAGCGADDLNRTDFIALTTQGDAGLSRPVANCVFDRVSSDELVLGELRDKGARSADLSDAVNSKMETFVAECILDANEADRAPSAKTTTTTKS